MPGVHIPIEDTSALLDRLPDYTLLLAWNFRREIAAQQAAYLAAGGRFIVPVPHPEVIA
jgi:5-formyltetrahydrofolate cyclo-ligase